MIRVIPRDSVSLETPLKLTKTPRKFPKISKIRKKSVKNKLRPNKIKALIKNEKRFRLVS